MSEKSKLEEAVLCRKADERGDFVQGDDGYVVFWPDHCPHGALAAWMLRALADELDRRNAAWDHIIQTDPAIGGTPDKEGVT